MSTSRPLLTWKNLTIGTLAVVIGKTFLKPRMKCFITEWLQHSRILYQITSNCSKKATK